MKESLWANILKYYWIQDSDTSAEVGALRDKMQR